MDPARNPAVYDFSINHHPFGSFSPGSNRDNDYEYHAVCDKGRCGFTLRVEAGRCGSNRLNKDINTELKSLQKFLNTTQKAFCRIVVTESLGIDTGNDAGETGSIRF
jgi:hypothetical protein